MEFRAVPFSGRRDVSLKYRWSGTFLTSGYGV
jgi:hypothetical protein